MRDLVYLCGGRGPLLQFVVMPAGIQNAGRIRCHAPSPDRSSRGLSGYASLTRPRLADTCKEGMADANHFPC